MRTSPRQLRRSTQVYLASDDLSVEHCVDVAIYVKRQLDVVRKLGADELRDGDVDWTLPQWR